MQQALILTPGELQAQLTLAAERGAALALESVAVQQYVSKRTAARLLELSESQIDELSKEGGPLNRYILKDVRGYRLLRSEVENYPQKAGTKTDEKSEVSVKVSVNLQKRKRKMTATA